MNPLALIPDRWRTRLYLGVFLIGVFLGACQVGHIEALWGYPVSDALNIEAYLGTALGLTAATNVTRTRSVVEVTPTEVEVAEASEG